MSSKTPYEIRTELLRLAYEICHQQAHAKGVIDHNNILVIVAPTSEQIIEEATKLNEFVSKTQSMK